MQHYRDVVQDRSGNVIGGAIVTVIDHSSGQSAPLYSDANGLIPLTSVITDINGTFSFYVASGRYDITVSKNGIVLSSVSDVFITVTADYPTAMDSATAQAGTSTTAQTVSASVLDGAVEYGSFTPSGTGAVSRTVQSKLRDVVSVFDFMTPTQIADVQAGTALIDVTSAIQTALNGSIRRILFPPGTYKLTSSLTINQSTEIIGSGSIQDPSDGGSTTQFNVTGDFDGIVVKATSYFGWFTARKFYIVKTGGTSKVNSGIKCVAWTPHVVIEQVCVDSFDIGLDLNLGLSKLLSINSRFNNVGFQTKGTSYTLQNCYANRNTTGYRVLEQTVYSSLINCASDSNTNNAYEFIGTTGPFTTNYQNTNSYLQMIGCGAESCGRYLYVDGSFDLDISSPSTTSMTTMPYMAKIESARRIKFRDIGPGFGLVNWIDINFTKCVVDVVEVEGDMPRFTQVSPPTTTYPAIPVAISGFKTLIGKIGLAKTRVPNIDPVQGASSGSVSTVEKGMFEASIPSTNKLRLKVEVMGNSNLYTCKINYSALYSSGAGDAGGNIWLCAGNSGGVNLTSTATSTDITVTRAAGASGVGPNGGTYYYFDIMSNRTYSYLWNIEAFTKNEVLRANMVTNYNNWVVKQAPSITSVIISDTVGNFTCSTAILTIGMAMIITGTFGGTGSITGYSSGNVYYVIATNGSTTFQLSATPTGAGITTTAGTPTGLTYNVI